MTVARNNTNENTFLWKSFINKDKDALGIIYHNCYDLLYNYGVKICSEEIVKDCIQDLFIKIYTSDNLKEIEYVEAFLLRSLRNLIFDRLPHYNKKINLDIDTLFDLTIEDYNTKQLFSHDDHDVNKQQLVTQAYNQLAPNYKQALYLRFIKRLSYIEISIVLGIKEQSAMNLISRSLSKIRKLVIK